MRRKKLAKKLWERRRPPKSKVFMKKIEKIKPKFVYDKNKKKHAVILTFKDFDLLIETLEDYDDYVFLKDFDSSKEERVPFEEVLAMLARK